MRAYVTVIGKTHYPGLAGRLVLTVILTGSGSGIVSAGQGVDPLAGYHEAWRRSLPLTGEPVVVGSLGPADRLVVSGTVDTGIHGVVFDARLHTNPGKHFRVRHDHLKLSPGLELVHGHHRGHRYVFRLPGESGGPRRVVVRLVGLPWRFRVSPASLVRASRSSLAVSLWRPGPAPQESFRARWLLVGGIAILMAALLAWLLWRVRRRGTASGTQD